MNHFDYIILGGGASGLMLATRFAEDPYFISKNILIIEKESQKINDKTWSYWSNQNEDWDHLVYKEWSNIIVKSEKSTRIFNSEFVYKMIKSEDFYTYCHLKISTTKNIVLVTESVHSIKEIDNNVVVETNKNKYYSTVAFNSIANLDVLEYQKDFPYLKQHFLGWFVKTDTPVFNENAAVFMDFNIPNDMDTRFMYVLPFSETEALVECTFFSQFVKDKQTYELSIQNYLLSINCSQYTITNKEYGIIPMTTYPLFKNPNLKIISIGTAGGWTKASTGYTFQNINKYTKTIIDGIKTNSNIHGLINKNKYYFFDWIILDVLQRRNDLGSKIFSSIFESNDIGTIFSFLDHKSNLFQDLSIVYSTKPKMQFIFSALRIIFIQSKIYAKSFYSNFLVRSKC